MEEDLQIRPYLLQMLLAGKFHHTNQYAEHPTWNTRDIGYVLIHRFTGNAVAFHLEIAQKSCLLLWNTYQIGKWIDIFDEDSTQVSHQTSLYIIIR